MCVCVCARAKRDGKWTGESGCSLSDGAETLETCIIDAVVNRGLQWPTGTRERRIRVCESALADSE